jgi:hypothetical protein
VYNKGKGARSIAVSDLRHSLHEMGTSCQPKIPIFQRKQVA